MKPFLLLMTLTLFSCEVIAQGGSDIKYVSADFIGSAHIGREIKLDLCKSQKDNKKFSGDTIALKLFGKDVLLFEHTKRGVDYWYYLQQTVECLNCDTSYDVIIDKAILSMIRTKTFKFRLYLDFYKKNERTKPLFSKTEEVYIDRNKVAGILLSK